MTRFLHTIWIILFLSTAVPLPAAQGPLDLPAEQAARIRAGINHLYNLEYEKSLACFNTLLPHYRTHPAPWFFRAMVFWIKGNHLEQSQDSDQAFLKYIKAAMGQARLRLKQHPRNAANYFYLAGGLGFLGRFHLNRRNWYQALVTGWEAYQLLKQAEKYQEQNQDIKLGLGFFNYYAGRLPATLKTVGKMLGVKGNWKLGLRQLHQAARHGSFANTEARIVLAHIYTYSMRDPRRAQPVLQGLMDDFPRNPWFRVAMAEVLLLSGKSDAALAMAQGCLARIGQGVFHKNWSFRVEALLGKILLSKRRYKPALNHLNRALACRPRKPEGFVPWVHLRRGRIYAHYGRFQRAEQELRRALDQPWSPKAQQTARYWLRWLRLKKKQAQKNKS